MAEYGLGSIYNRYNRPNPHDRTAKAAGFMMGNSGYAAPGLAYVMGKEMAAGGQFDEQQYRDAMGAATDEKSKTEAQAIFKNIIELSKGDPEGATALMKAESAKNPLLARYKDIQFNAATKDNWMFVDGKAIYLKALDMRNPDGNMMSVKQMEEAGYLRTIKDAPKKDSGIGNISTKDYTGASIDKFKRTGNHADLVPVKGDGDGSSSGVPKDADYRAWHSKAEADAYKKVFANKLSRDAELLAMMNRDPEQATAMLSKAMTPEQAKAIEIEIDAYMQKNTTPGVLKQYLEIKKRGAAEAMTKSPGAAGAPAVQGGAQLDASTAQQILMEAGGDKNKAREIARQRGYNF